MSSISGNFCGGYAFKKKYLTEILNQKVTLYIYVDSVSL